MGAIGAEGPAQHAVRPALVQQHGGDQRAIASYFSGSEVALQPPPAAKVVVRLRSRTDDGFVIEARDIHVAARLDPQPELTNSRSDRLRPADQDRSRQVLVHHDLRCPQDPIVLALSVGNPPRRRRGCGGKDRLHYGAGGIDEALQ